MAVDFAGHGNSSWLVGGGYTPELFVADADAGATTTDPLDNDTDGQGDACDLDDDNDGMPEVVVTSGSLAAETRLRLIPGWLSVLPALLLGGMMLGALGLLLSVYIKQLENFAGIMP